MSPRSPPPSATVNTPTPAHELAHSDGHNTPKRVDSHSDTSTSTCNSLRSTQLSSSTAASSTDRSARCSDTDRNSFEPVCFGEWVYWQRDSAREPECWTKVFAVVEEDASVGLYGCEDLSPRTLVHRRSMASVRVEMSRRRIKLLDMRGAVIMRLWLLTYTNHAIWKVCLDRAVLVAQASTCTMPQSLTTTGASSNDAPAVAGSTSVSMLTFRSLRDATRAPTGSKRSVVKAVCKATLEQVKRRLQEIAER